MSDSLRDQLLKAGFAAPPKAEAPARAPQRARPAGPSGRTDSRPQRPNASPRSHSSQRPNASQRQDASQRKPASERSEIDLAKAYALRDKNEREQREREQRAAEQRAREKKERRLKLAAALNGKAMNDAAAEIPRHFPHGGKIRRIYVTAQQLPRLNGGELAVAQLAGRYLLVTRETGLAAQAIDADALVLLCDPQAADDEDIPADLIW